MCIRIFCINQLIIASKLELCNLLRYSILLWSKSYIKKSPSSSPTAN